MMEGLMEVFLQFYNNNGGGSSTSTVDAIETPINGYNYDLEPGGAYEPSSHTWRHTCNGYASGQSSQNRMSNGNVFVNISGGQGGSGYMYEADSVGNVIWQYNAGGTPKAFRYECNDLGIISLLDNPCDINNQSLSEGDLNQLVISPNPSSGIFNITGIQSKEFNITVVNAFGQMIKKQNTTLIDLSDCSNGLYFINIVDAKGVSTLKSISLTK